MADEIKGYLIRKAGWLGRRKSRLPLEDMPDTMLYFPQQILFGAIDKVGDNPVSYIYLHRRDEKSQFSSTSPKLLAAVHQELKSGKGLRVLREQWTNPESLDALIQALAKVQSAEVEAQFVVNAILRGEYSHLRYT